MNETLYFISEVSKIVGVEPHVLRYWEEELNLEIGRNSQGKRCYTEEDVELLCRAKYWKDKGMQLKAVREVLERERGSEAENSNAESYEISVIEQTPDPMQKLEQILDAMIGRALERNNEKLVRELCEAILRELDEKMEMRMEERMEELLQQELMKEMLRQGEQEAAVSREQRKRGSWREKWRQWAEKHL